MKRILFFMAVLSILISCKKTSYVAKFDKSPQERAADQISLVSNTLTGAPNGWIATLSTESGGGFGFYVNFDKEQNVNMIADLTDASSSVVSKSYYRVKQDIGTGLVFDSYTYISMLDDPNAGVYGGAAKIGYKSDIEFTYDHSTADSIIFTGKKYRQAFKLVKATAAQKASYEAAGLKTAIDKFKAYFTENKNPYVEIGTLKIGVTPNLSTSMANGKRVDFTGVLGDGKTIGSKNSKFAYSLTGIDFLNGGLVFENINFVRFTWKDATTIAAYDATGKEYIIKNSVAPIVPLYLLWGAKYGGMLSDFKAIYPGTSQAGSDILSFYHNGLGVPAVNGIATFNYGRINFVWNIINSRVTINAHSSQSLGVQTWITTSVYNYTIDANGIYKFTLNSPPTGGYSDKLIARLHAFMLANRVAFDYYVDGGTTYAKMSSVDDPSIVMTFVLQ